VHARLPRRDPRQRQALPGPVQAHALRHRLRAPRVADGHALRPREEQAPSLYDFKPLARLLGFPYFPLTPTFPWLGALGGIPYPTKYRIEFGEPIRLDGRGDESDEFISGHVEYLRSVLRIQLDRLLAERQHVFW
jgi:hypothetical protein